MKYRELLEFTQKHPNPFWNRAQHDKDFEMRYNAWVEQQNSFENIKKDTKMQKNAMY